ncbi:MAG: malate:quinone oxidoreductase, partial [Lysobacteraceae bacterium]
GSWWDLYSSVNHNNVGPMLEVGKDNLDLVQYLMGQARLNDADRQAELVKYFPTAKPGDWKLVTAGQRVQIIKRDPLKGPVLQFGTEIVTDKDHTIAALLGASPGASTSPPIMLDLMAKAFPDQMKAGWEARLREIVPSYGRKLNDSAALVNEIRTLTSQTLHLPYLEVPVDANAASPAAAAVPAAAKEKRNANEELQAL